MGHMLSQPGTAVSLSPPICGLQEGGPLYLVPSLELVQGWPTGWLCKWCLDGAWVPGSP